MKEEITLLTEADISLMKEVLEDDNMLFDEEVLKKYLTFQQNKGFIIKIDNKIVGFAYCYELVRPDGRIMLYLHSIGFLSVYQGKGLGTKLLTYIKKYAIDNKYSEMFVITDKGNSRACHLYEKLGGKNDCEDEIVYVYDFEKEV
jgi:ribosomal protein S18 acetylase RimI-like enzyme